MENNGASSHPKAVQKVEQEQIHGLLFGNKLSWQEIIYDLINTEQLDPWDIDLCLLAQKYLSRVRELEEANFFVSSKVLFAASLLLRMKSEILLHEDLKSLDDILFGRKDEKRYIQERIELDEEIPELVPRTPLPRGRRVTLPELMAALGKAITTENRRIRRVVIDRQREFETAAIMPKGKSKNLKEQVAHLYGKVKDAVKHTEDKIGYGDVIGQEENAKASFFLPLLHLDNQHKLVAEQEKTFDEIWVWLKEHHNKKFAVEREKAKKEAQEAIQQELEEKNKSKKNIKEEKSEKN